MRFMLDTNICIYIIKQKPEKVLSHFKDHSIGDIGISSITLAELQYGAAKSLQVAKNHEAIEGFALPLEIADFDGKAAYAYGIVRAELKKGGNPVGAMDMLIGAHALSMGTTLVTNNVKEFKRIKKLKLVNWAE